MSEERTEYRSKPAQFRFPRWAHEFIARESAEKHITKTEVIVRALEYYERREHDALLEEGYRECGEFLLQEVREWDALGIDAPMEPEDWSTDAPR